MYSIYVPLLRFPPSHWFKDMCPWCLRCIVGVPLGKKTQVPDPCQTTFGTNLVQYNPVSVNEGSFIIFPSRLPDKPPQW